jgi:pimeloyl-ACP methyl ester carboxylesterase
VATFVLVHGAWTGGWIWQRVRPILYRAGHEVFTPTLTGLGERAHLAEHEIDLDTHIEDIFRVLEYEHLREVVLVGHGYGGMVVSGVADHVPEWIDRLVYLDAQVPQNGQSEFDLLGHEMEARLRKLAWTSGSGWRVPVPDDYANLRGGDARWVHSYAVGQPTQTFEQKIHLSDWIDLRIRRSYIRCSRGREEEPLPAYLAPALESEGQGWRYLELDTGHAPQVTAPRQIVDTLLDVVSEL